MVGKTRVVGKRKRFLFSASLFFLFLFFIFGLFEIKNAYSTYYYYGKKIISYSGSENVTLSAGSRNIYTFNATFQFSCYEKGYYDYDIYYDDISQTDYYTYYISSNNDLYDIAKEYTDFGNISGTFKALRLYRNGYIMITRLIEPMFLEFYYILAKSENLSIDFGFNTRMRIFSYRGKTYVYNYSNYVAEYDYRGNNPVLILVYRNYFMGYMEFHITNLNRTDHYCGFFLRDTDRTMYNKFVRIRNDEPDNVVDIYAVYCSNRSAYIGIDRLVPVLELKRTPYVSKLTDITYYYTNWTTTENYPASYGMSTWAYVGNVYGSVELEQKFKNRLYVMHVTGKDGGIGLYRTLPSVYSGWQISADVSAYFSNQWMGGVPSFRLFYADAEDPSWMVSFAYDYVWERYSYQWKKAGSIYKSGTYYASKPNGWNVFRIKMALEGGTNIVMQCYVNDTLIFSVSDSYSNFPLTQIYGLQMTNNWGEFNPPYDFAIDGFGIHGLDIFGNETFHFYPNSYLGYGFDPNPLERDYDWDNDWRTPYYTSCNVANLLQYESCELEDEEIEEVEISCEIKATSHTDEDDILYGASAILNYEYEHLDTNEMNIGNISHHFYTTPDMINQANGKLRYIWGITSKIPFSCPFDEYYGNITYYPEFYDVEGYAANWSDSIYTSIIFSKEMKELTTDLADRFFIEILNIKRYVEIEILFENEDPELYVGGTFMWQFTYVHNFPDHWEYYGFSNRTRIVYTVSTPFNETMNSSVLLDEYAGLHFANAYPWDFLIFSQTNQIALIKVNIYVSYEYRTERPQEYFDQIIEFGLRYMFLLLVPFLLWSITKSLKFTLLGLIISGIICGVTGLVDFTVGMIATITGISGLIYISRKEQSIRILEGGNE